MILPATGKAESARKKVHPCKAAEQTESVSHFRNCREFKIIGCVEGVGRQER